MVKAVLRIFDSSEDQNVKELGEYDPLEHYELYSKIYDITKNNPLAISIASWAELAMVGQIYEFEGGEVEIVDLGDK